ncbi:hypothetical protein BP6252_12546 [Coleophoma cylindrospora]|uniref:NADH:flavin oxidoreductase/NADH oxidase N-terminal domain-containing protein n=1 Tax=Coleophoma cylindrospora TaxID=1849047 RepID=A0A3D8QCE8_9HELO|nr:hypothetical protein BP6252_12546 [Coleophoma cylindrospora]
MATPTIASPLTLPNGVVIANRLAKAAMAENLAPKSNVPDENFKRIYKIWAAGGWGIVMTGNVQVDPAHLGSPQDLSVDQSRLSDPVYLKAWQEWADACKGSTTIVQINHPGRQTPMGAGNRGMFAKAVAPSAIPLNFGDSIIAQLMRALLFGTPRALATEEVEVIIEQFVAAGKLSYDSGFQGVEIHGAHGYLLAQFMSSGTNKRTDAFGGSASKRVEIVVRIINGIREKTSPDFIIGLKLNSVDQATSGDSNEDCIEQVRRIVDAGIDFLEISGGSYESPTMSTGLVEKSARTKAREAYFLEFAQLIRQNVPKVPLMVTGGFRTLAGIEAAIASKDTDMVGIGRPACLEGKLPKEILLNSNVTNKEEVVLQAPKQELNWFMKKVPIKAIGAGAEGMWYSAKLQLLGL